MKKTCERCNRVFECQPENISACGCSGVQLSPLTRQTVAKQFGDCLCVACLKELEQRTQAEEQSAQ